MVWYGRYGVEDWTGLCIRMDIRVYPGVLMGCVELLWWSSPDGMDGMYGMYGKGLVLYHCDGKVHI